MSLNNVMKAQIDFVCVSGYTAYNQCYKIQKLK